MAKNSREGRKSRGKGKGNEKDAGLEEWGKVSFCCYWMVLGCVFNVDRDWVLLFSVFIDADVYVYNIKVSC